MARQSRNSLFNSLRGKIWISTSVLAFFTCTFGLISYLVVSLLVNDVFYGVFIPFLMLAFVIMIFGWWLSSEVVDPIEKVTLLAKSLERSTSTSIPRTSGSTETDQLLQTIQRNNQQLQKIVSLMENVASGNMDFKPLEGSDRLSSSFQKLLSKVSESINAKSELNSLQDSLTNLKMDVSGVKSGNLNVQIRNDSEETRELSDTFRYLIDNLARLISAVQMGSTAAESSARRIDGEIQSLVQRDENRIQEMSKAALRLKQVPNLINKITEDLTSSAKSAQQTIQKAQQGSQVANDNSQTVGLLRKQVRQDVKRIQSLNERSHDIERVAKTVEDLANRTNMIALNASIQATEMGEDGHGFVLVAEEVEKLATRANGTNKQISTLNKTILSEIRKVENSVDTTMGEVANLSKFAIETANVLNEMERYITQFLTLQENLISYSQEQSEETDNAFAVFDDSIAETETTVKKVKDSGSELESLAKAMKDLKTSISEFRIDDEEEADISPELLQPDAFDNVPGEDALYEEFVSKEFDSNEAPVALEEESAVGEQYESEESVAAEAEPSENSTEQPQLIVSPPELSDEYDDDIIAESYNMDEEGESISDDFDSDDFAELSMSVGSYVAEEDGNPEFASEGGDEEKESGVFDLYEQSLNGETDGDFDSGEFTVDELIDESDSVELETAADSEDSEIYELDEDLLGDLSDEYSNETPKADPDNTLSI